MILKACNGSHLLSFSQSVTPLLDSVLSTKDTITLTQSEYNPFIGKIFGMLYKIIT